MAELENSAGGTEGGYGDSGLPEPDREWLARVSNPLPVRKSERPTVLLAPRSPAELDAQVQELRALTAIPASSVLRRGLFMWLRVYVIERKASGKMSRVNVRVPIPLPLVGLLLPWRMSKKQALELLNRISDSADGAALADRALASHMPFEVVHVEEANPKTGAWEYVVVGLE